MEFGDLSDNPFALDLTQAKSSHRKSVVSALKFLSLVAVCFVVIVVISSQSHRWLVHRLTHDLDSLEGDAKLARLVQIADLDDAAIHPLVKSLADDDSAVARMAFDLLHEAQKGWTVLSDDQQQQRHAALVDELKAMAVHIPDDRTGWGNSLLQQTVLATVDRQDDQSRDLYRNATHAIEMLSLSDRSGPSILNPEPLDPQAPRRLTIRSKPLPLSFAEVDLNDPRSKEAPIAQNDSPAAPSTARISTARIIARSNGDRRSETEASEAASVYRSTSVRLRPIDGDEPVLLRDPASPQTGDSSGQQRLETSHRSELAAGAEIQSATHLVQSPMETFDDKSVMHWLGSPHQALRDKARLELISRGYDGTQINIATQIASGDLQTRIALIDAIARSNSIDPRPWLLMMLGDQSRDVKLRVVSVLATMKDPDVRDRLQQHLVDERDPTVAFRIRRVLDLH